MLRWWYLRQVLPSPTVDQFATAKVWSSGNRSQSSSQTFKSVWGPKKTKKLCFKNLLCSWGEKKHICSQKSQIGCSPPNVTGKCVFLGAPCLQIQYLNVPRFRSLGRPWTLYLSSSPQVFGFGCLLPAFRIGSQVWGELQGSQCKRKTQWGHPHVFRGGLVSLGSGLSGQWSEFGIIIYTSSQSTEMWLFKKQVQFQVA